MKTTDLFKINRTSKRLNESMFKTFGRKLNLETFNIEQLEDARNKLRTQIYTARSSSSFNENVENDALSQAQFMHDAIVAELSERDEPIVDNTVDEGGIVTNFGIAEGPNQGSNYTAMPAGFSQSSVVRPIGNEYVIPAASGFTCLATDIPFVVESVFLFDKGFYRILQ
jgi:hypothetical protein